MIKMENTITRLQLKVMYVHSVCSSVYVITIALIKIQPKLIINNKTFTWWNFEKIWLNICLNV